MKIIRLAILISGSGTTMEAILRSWKENQLLSVKPVLVVASNPDAGGLIKAQKYNVDTAVIDRRNYNSFVLFSQNLLETLQSKKIDAVSQNGWLPLTPVEVIRAFQGKIINQHPGPLDTGHPDFGGKGMYGARVTTARIIYLFLTGEAAWTEVTTHHVSADFDRGDIIRSVRIPLPEISGKITLKNIINNPQNIIELTGQIQKLILPFEHQNVIETLKLLSLPPLPFFKRTYRLIDKKKLRILAQAKNLAIKLFPDG